MKRHVGSRPKSEAAVTCTIIESLTFFLHFPWLEECPEFPGPNDPERARRLYRAACKRLRVTPCSKVIRSVVLGSVNISHQGLGPVGIKALAIGLVVSLANDFVLFRSRQEILH